MSRVGYTYDFMLESANKALDRFCTGMDKLNEQGVFPDEMWERIQGCTSVSRKLDSYLNGLPRGVSYESAKTDLRSFLDFGNEVLFYIHAIKYLGKIKEEKAEKLIDDYKLYLNTLYKISIDQISYNRKG